jgi:hypothetical protein
MPFAPRKPVELPEIVLKGETFPAAVLEKTEMESLFAIKI